MAYTTSERIDSLMNGDALKKVKARLIDVSIEKAESIVNGFIAQAYSVPFIITVPALVQSLTEDLTLYYLFRSGYFDGVAGNDKETVEGIWDKSIKTLGLIAKGLMLLPDVDPSEQGSDLRLAQIDSTTKDYHPWADLGAEKDWIPDADRIDAVQDAKE